MTEQDLRLNNVEIETLTVNSGADYYSLPGLVDMLSKNGRLELLMEIMSLELPKRKPGMKLETV